MTAADRPGEGTGCFRHGDNTSPPLRGIEQSIRPGTPVPPTVLIAEMGGGALYLAGWRTGPSAYLVAADAAQLRRELAEAFGTRGDAGARQD